MVVSARRSLARPVFLWKIGASALSDALSMRFTARETSVDHSIGIYPVAHEAFCKRKEVKKIVSNDR